MVISSFCAAEEGPEGSKLLVWDIDVVVVAAAKSFDEEEEEEGEFTASMSVSAEVRMV